MSLNILIRTPDVCQWISHSELGSPPTRIRHCTPHISHYSYWEFFIPLNSSRTVHIYCGNVYRALPIIHWIASETKAAGAGNADSAPDEAVRSRRQNPNWIEVILWAATQGLWFNAVVPVAMTITIFGATKRRQQRFTPRVLPLAITHAYQIW